MVFKAKIGALHRLLEDAIRLAADREGVQMHLDSIAEFVAVVASLPVMPPALLADFEAECRARNWVPAFVVFAPDPDV